VARLFKSFWAQAHGAAYHPHMLRSGRHHGLARPGRAAGPRRGLRDRLRGGFNQRFYDKAAVSAFAGIDPSDKLLDFARAEAARKGWATDIRAGVGEAIPFPSESFDTAVCT